MAAEIKLCKTDERPWGFRLTGGRDFGTPLTIIKVGVDTVAEQAGMKVGDILIRINEEPCHLLAHREIQEKIRQSGNTVSLSVLRGSLTIPGQVLERLSPLPLQDINQCIETQETHTETDLPLPLQESLPVVDPNIEIIPIRDLEPEQLAELGLKPLPGDFLEKAMRDPSPLPEVRPQSCSTPAPEVIQVLENLGLPEIIHQIEEHREELIQQPLPEEVRPVETEQSETTEQIVEAPPTQVVPVQTVNLEDIPKKDFSEQEIADIILERVEVIEGTNALGVNFKKYEPQTDFIKKSQVFQTLNEQPVEKQEKSKRWTTFLEKPNRPVIKPKPKPKQGAVRAEPVQVEPEPTLEPPQEEIKQHGLYEIPPEEEFEALVQLPEPVIPTTEVAQETVEEGNEQLEHEGGEQNLTTEEELLQHQYELEQQLTPNLSHEEKSEIELQLEEIQKQLEAIQQLPFEIQQHLSLVQEQLTKIVQLRQHEHEVQQQTEEITKVEEQVEPLPEPVETQEEKTEPTEAPAESEPEAVIEDAKQEFKLRAVEDEPILPPEKKPKPKKQFMGIGPAPRPLVLPGGRRWKTPKDAYNDEFIAETLSAQAEIITGTTLGVNFRKYEPKHPNLDFLKTSNVYRMVHDLEETNFSDRPEIVPALQDYQATPAAI